MWSGDAGMVNVFEWVWPRVYRCHWLCSVVIF